MRRVVNTHISGTLYGISGIQAEPAPVMAYEEAGAFLGYHENIRAVS
ncbi:MAG: hypothetical protein LBB81_11740 [Treponema sp.]|jgi:hypothetical protein|nr:hypothetical protein [Treponema sp.]